MRLQYDETVWSLRCLTHYLRAIIDAVRYAHCNPAHAFFSPITVFAA